MTSTAAAEQKPGPSLTMQIIIRRDLQTEHGWPVGPLMAQAAHAATAVLEIYKDDPRVKIYLGDLEGMRKVTMEIPTEEDLKGLATKLDQMTTPIPYYLWQEQPENTPTALALVPNSRPKALKKILDETGCQLWK